MNQIESIIARVKGIIFYPKKEWEIISKEEKTTGSIFSSYLLPLSAISLIACYIGYGVVGSKQGIFGLVATAELGYRYASFTFINLITGTFTTALILSILAPVFNAEKNFDKVFKLVVYSYTPILVGSIFYIVPLLSPLVFLSGIYGLYLLYTGLQPITNVPDNKASVYFAISLVTTVVVYVLISIIFTHILLH